MSVTDRNKIDVISTNPEGKVVLTISDHLVWDEENKHLLVLQDKINDYLDVLQSDQIYEIYPDALGKQIIVQAVFEYLPNKTGEEFLIKVGQFLKSNGYEFSYYHLNS